jgi:hypothetical protein
MERYLRSPDTRNSLGTRQTNNALRELRAIRSQERSMRHDRMGNLSASNLATAQRRVDRLNDRLQIASR